jgi:superfamily I DNA and/or RNA helicase
VHCLDTTCIIGETTKSKRNPDQVENTLEFLSDLVKGTPGVSASSIAIISPYKANAALVERRRKDPKCSVLFAMPPTATVDSFQGREADIIAVIMGTTQEVGPGFTTDEHRLNVMLSR